MTKLAIVASHPIQYYAPWFRILAKEKDLSIKVFYLWDSGVTEKRDRGFKQDIKWDIPLLDDYEYEFVPNLSCDAGTHRFSGLNNPNLIARLESFNPDAVLCTVYNYLTIYRLLFSSFAKKIPLLFRGDSHRVFESKGPKALLRRLWIKRIFKKFAAFLYVGMANKDYFKYHGVAEAKLNFSPHAIDNRRFIQARNNIGDQAQVWKKELGIPEDHLVVLFAGKFEEKKRPQDLLQAYLRADLEKAVLLFVGAGALEAKLKKMAKGINHIFFAPFQNQSEMPRVYAAADLLVLPSYGAHETWGLVVNEAMCFSVPAVLSSHVGCAYDLLKPHENGLIFKAGDIEALRKALEETLSDRERLGRWGVMSFERVSRYTYEMATLGLKEALKGVLRND